MLSVINRLRSNVDRSKYCQLTSTKDDRKFIIMSVCLYLTKLTTRCDDRRVVAKISKFRIWYKVLDGITLIVGDTQISLRTVHDRSKEVSMPKTSSHQPGVSTEHRLVKL